jgi:hypothetical protein
LAIVALIVSGVAGTVAVWWLSSYMDSLVELAATDRDAALALFRSRVLPALIVVVLVAVAAGALLLRQGLQVAREGIFPSGSARLIRDTPRRTGGSARLIGMVLAIAGFLLAAVPLVMISLVFWILRRA